LFLVSFKIKKLISLCRWFNFYPLSYIFEAVKWRIRNAVYTALLLGGSEIAHTPLALLVFLCSVTAWNIKINLSLSRTVNSVDTSAVTLIRGPKIKKTSIARPSALLLQRRRRKSESICIRKAEPKSAEWVSSQEETVEGAEKQRCRKRGGGRHTRKKEAKKTAERKSEKSALTRPRKSLLKGQFALVS